MTVNVDSCGLLFRSKVYGLDLRKYPVTVGRPKGNKITNIILRQRVQNNQILPVVMDTKEVQNSHTIGMRVFKKLVHFLSFKST